MPAHPDRGVLREQLRALIAEFARHESSAIDDDTPLISSALVESMALLNVAPWVEGHIAATVEITSFDLAAEWDSIGKILDFIEKYRLPSASGR